MPATRLRFRFNGNGTYFIDLAKCLSLAERKLHRQKQIYTVYGGYYKDQNGSTIHFNPAPNTWPVKRAINRGFALWRKMIARTLQDMEGAGTGSYSDFKVLLNEHMTGSTELPVDAYGHQLSSGTAEWDYTTMTSEDPDGPGGNLPDQFELMIVGDHVGSDPNWTRLGLLQSWVNSRALPDAHAPDLPSQFEEDPLNNLFDAGDVQDDRLAVLANENDAAPYDEDSMWGNGAPNNSASANLQRMSSAQSSEANPIPTVMGFEAVCGLIEVVITGGDTSAELVIDVESKGVKF